MTDSVKTPAPVRLNSVAEREFFPGFRGRIIHSDSMSFAYWIIDAGASLPEHHHHHEQVVNVLEGEFELVLDGVRHRLSANEVLVIPCNVPHSGAAITDCRILDVFSPVREDYR